MEVTHEKSKNILTEHEMELVNLLMADCQSTGDIPSKHYSDTLKRLYSEPSYYLSVLEKKIGILPKLVVSLFFYGL